MSNATAEYDVVLDQSTQRAMRPFLLSGDRVFQRHTAPGQDDEYMVVRAGTPDPEGWFFVGEKGTSIR